MRLVPIALLALALAACGGGSKPAPSTTTVATTTATASTKLLHVVMGAQSHHPKVGQTWSYSVTVTDAATGKPVAAHIHLQMWFNGASVGEVGVHNVKSGVWKETIPAKGPNAFPPAAIGQPLTLHAAVTSPGYREASAGWKLSVVK